MGIEDDANWRRVGVADCFVFLGHRGERLTGRPERAKKKDQGVAKEVNWIVPKARR